MNIALIGNAVLRQAIQRNLVSFPSQVPAFMKRRPSRDTPAPVDKEDRIVQLYFVRGWQVRTLCDRYRLSKPLVQKILTEWRIRAVAGGYIQDIHPESIDLLVAEYEARQHNALRYEAMKHRVSEPAEVESGVTLPGSVWEMLASAESERAAARGGL